MIKQFFKRIFLITFFLSAVTCYFSLLSSPVFAGMGDLHLQEYLQSLQDHPFVETPQKGQQQLQDKTIATFPFVTDVTSGLTTYVLLATAGEETYQQALGPNGQPLTQNGQPVYETVHKGGAIEIVSNLTASLYTNKPASSIDYIADIGTNLGLVKPAYAQGIGFTAFTPVLELWKLFRNIAYAAFVIIFLVIGFMIMFRKKIDPRTVVTVQDAIPRIVMTLLLITFSYAIAGLLVDLSDLSIRLIASLFKDWIGLGTNGKTDPNNIDAILKATTFALVNPLRNVTGVAAAVSQTVSGAGVQSIAWLTASVVFWLVGFYAMFKIFFALLGPYVSIILQTILAPIQLLFSALPGNNTSLTSWLKSFLSNVLVFPVTFALLAIAAIVKGESVRGAAIIAPNVDWAVKPQTFNLLWSPPMLGNWGQTVGELAAFGILLTIPKVTEMVKGMLQYKPQPWEGAEAGQELRKAGANLPVIGGLFKNIS